MLLFSIKSTDRPIKIEIVVETADKSSLVNRLAPKVNEKPAPKKKALKWVSYFEIARYWIFGDLVLQSQ